METGAWCPSNLKLGVGWQQTPRPEAPEDASRAWKPHSRLPAACLLQGSTLVDAALANRHLDALLSRPMTKALSPGHERDRPPDRKTEVPKPHAN